MVIGQGVHPGGQEKVQLLDGELIEDPFDDGSDVLLIQLQAVAAHTGHVIAVHNVGLDGLGPVGLGIGRVQEDQEGLAQLLELGNDPLLRLDVVLPGDVGDGPVGGDHDADGGVFGNDLSRPDLRGLGHGDVVVIPGGGHHSRGVVLGLSHGAGDHIAHAVDETDGEGGPVGHIHPDGLLGHELGLSGHHRPA